MAIGLPRSVLGVGDWRTKTEHRPDPACLHVGEKISLPGEWGARVTCLVQARRLIEVSFSDERAVFWEKLLPPGQAHPVFLSSARGAGFSWSAQTAFAGRPWAAEMPSAGQRIALGAAA